MNHAMTDNPFSWIDNQCQTEKCYREAEDDEDYCIHCLPRADQDLETPTQDEETREVTLYDVEIHYTAVKSGKVKAGTENEALDKVRRSNQTPELLEQVHTRVKENGTETEVVQEAEVKTADEFHKTLDTHLHA